MTLPLPRRDLLISGVAFGAAGSLPAARAETVPAPATLTAGRRTLDVNGKAASVFALTQPDGTAGLTTSVNDPFRVHLVNDAGVDTLIHWHGLIAPYQQDGVPGLSGPPIAAGATAAYDFPLRQTGTYWMHSHVGFQEQRLMTAPLIIHAAAAPTERELVVMLHDFTFTSPDEIFARLRGRSGLNASGGARQTGGMQMRKDAAPDLNDVSYDAFLADDRTLADPSVVRVDPGERLRLRIINGASASNFHLRLGGLKARVMAVDGQPVQPMTVSSFPLAIAQRVDLLVRLPNAQGAWPVFAVVEGLTRCTGVVLATSRARVTRLSDEADGPSAAMGLETERLLRPVSPLQPRRADRVLRVALTGDMQAYIWTLNGKVYGQDTPLMVKRGERVEVIMPNETMMSHPMHLHGHSFQVVEIDGRRLSGAMRDTVLVPPKRTVTIAFDADNPGKWAFHCHNLYHLEAGMMTSVRYEGL